MSLLIFGIGAMDIFLLLLLVLVVYLVLSCVKIVPQAHVKIIERLGSYLTTWEAGLHFKMPFIDKAVHSISLKEQVADFNPQAVITKDNVTMRIDTVIFYQVTDPKMFTYGIDNPINAIDNLSSTTLRNIIGDLELDETLTSRDVINTKMREILDDATDPWGIKVNRVELKNILPPPEIQDAMEKQMKAEREKRKSVLIAQGEKESAILRAEGEKESAVLRAEANKESQIRIAEGEAQAILKVYEARARGMELLKAAKADEAVLSLRAMEAMEKVADGRATKIIVPSELQNMAGLVSAVKSIADTPEPVLDESAVEELKEDTSKSHIPNVSLDMDRDEEEDI